MNCLSDARIVAWRTVAPLLPLMGALLGIMSSAAVAQPAGSGPSATEAIDEVVSYRSFTRANGLPHATIQSLAQAPDGRLWIGTSAGLAVYDGHRIQPASLPDSLANGFVCGILTFESGTVWLSVRNRALVALRNGRVERVVSPPPEPGCPARLIGRGDTLVTVAETTAWTLSTDAGILEKTPYTYHTEGKHRELSKTIEAADQAPDGTLWVLDERLGPGRLAPDGTVTFVDAPRFADASTEWVSLEFSSEGDAFIRSADNTYRFDPVSGTLQRLASDSYARPYSQGPVVYATATGTVRRWNFRTGRTRSFGPALGLPETQYYAVLEDDRGGLWIGTQRELLFLPTPETRNIRSIGGERIRWTTDISKNPNTGSVWLSTWGRGLFRLSQNPAPASPAETRSTPTREDDRWMLDVRLDAEHLNALGTAGWFRRDDAEWRRIHPELQALTGYVDTTGAGVFWTNNGIVRAHPVPSAPIDTLRTWSHEHADYYRFRPFSDGTLLLRARGHLVRRSPYAPTEADTVASFPRLADVEARSMALLNDQVWLGTRSDGLFRLNWQDGTIESLLPDRRVFSLSTAGDSLVLAGTNDGLYLLEAETGATYRRLTTANGLLSNTAAGRFVDDTLYVRHPYGATTLPRSMALSAPRSPNPTITGLSVHGESRAPVDSTRLAVDERTLTIRFSGVHLAEGTDVRHTYRLVPYDTTWQATTDRRVRYTDLPPGSYTFQVRAGLTDAPVGGPASLHVALPPAYYETTWFWWLCGLAGLGLLAGGYALRVRTLQQRQEELQRLVGERTRRLAKEKEKTQKQAERLAELDDEKNRFFANISHELRTPLTLLVGILQEALDGVFGDPPAPLRRQLEIMQKHLDRIQRLADQLLDLSRLEATDPGLEPEPRDLVAFVRGLVQAFAPLADRRGITLELDAAPDTHPCRFDPEKLEKLFDNLLSNALKFTPEGGSVTVRLHVEPFSKADAPPTAVVEVDDTGPGIPEDQQDHIFERFSLSQSQDGDAAGTGLGLALAREFAKMHGGTIELDSIPGQGSTFTVRLPLPVVDADTVEESTAVAPDASSSSTLPLASSGDGKPTSDDRATDASAPESDEPVLLVAEDNADVRAYLRRHLDDQWTVVETADGTEALNTARRREPDLVVADVMMPELDGLALTRRLRDDDTLDHIPILLLTARAGEEDAVAGLEAGADDYVTKPFSIDELRARIEQLLEARRSWADTATDTLLTPEVELTSADEAFLTRVTGALDEHLSRSSLTVDDLAEEVGISPRQLQRKLKDLTGHTAATFMRRYRLECAAELLADGGNSVSQIAYRVGFGTPETFTRHFEEQFDCRPSAYAETHSSN